MSNERWNQRPPSRQKNPPASDQELAGPYWSQPPDRLLTALKSSPTGLSSGEAQRRLQQFGPNSLKVRRRATALGLFVNQFKNPLVLILVFGAIVSVFAQEWTDAAIVLVIILGSSLLSFWQEYRATNAVEELRARVQSKATVLRDGQPQAILAEAVVPGDVVQLAAGSLIPADGVLLEANDLFVSQAVLTGETFPVAKEPGAVAANVGLAERTNAIFMGASVRSGSALALITVTGPATAFGQIAERLTSRPPETEFEHGIRRFGYLITQVMVGLVVAVFAINVLLQRPPIDSLLFAVALAVGMAPELLPAIISITLARGAQDMAARGVIVRRLNAIENLGSMDMLCTDKTGTLTLGVVQLNSATDAQGISSDCVLRAAYLNASFQSGLPNVLDDAIITHANEVGLVAAPDAKAGEIPYDFVRKRLSVGVRDSAGQRRLITKGALENVLAVCTHAQQGDKTVALDDAHKEEIRTRYAGWSSQGYRVLGVATKPLATETRLTHDDESDLSFAGFLLFFDPPKPGIQKTIADLANLGVQIKIITGDNRLVAAHVADVVGLPVAGLLTGDEINKLSDEALWNQARRTTLFVEVDPNEKERIILALRKMGHVVGYMGDGINDAPALHAADVGISVDQAVDVAKEAADFVLLQQDLDVLRQGIEEGRTTFANSMKYVFTTTSANFGNMFSMAGASMFLPFLPLLPKQILLNNFLSDFPSMAIATDNVDRQLVETPHRWNIRFIRDIMVIFGLISSVFDYLTFALLLYVVRAAPAEFRTGWFVESLLTELFITLVLRTRQPLFKSKPGRYLWLSTVIVTLVALAIPYLPLNGLLGFTPLPPLVLVLLLALTLLYIAVSEIAKRIYYARLTQSAQ
ncbi:MAG: magnesium-translocating P-type ATPase [Caldilineaceae bacterium]|nr:magnesium-translocating P-type ATPase [Caldilineaceae bacterium]